MAFPNIQGLCNTEMIPTWKLPSLDFKVMWHKFRKDKVKMETTRKVREQWRNAALWKFETKKWLPSVIRIKSKCFPMYFMPYMIWPLLTWENSLLSFPTLNNSIPNNRSVFLTSWALPTLRLLLFSLYGCYGLNVCVPCKFICWILTPKVMVFGVGSLGGS